jgi:hypothetical protein
MATSGPQAIPGVTLHEAYRFVSTDDPPVEGTVFKKLPPRIVWEARVDNTTITATGETRREAVERALAARGQLE